MQVLKNEFPLLAYSTILGVITGVAISLFRLILSWSIAKYDGLWLIAVNNMPNLVLLITFTIILFVGGRIIAVRYPYIAGSGIPLLIAWLRDNIPGGNWLCLATAKLIGSIASITIGLSFGKEGPATQTGALLGLAVQRYTKSSLPAKVFLGCGAGAGLGAVLNAPLSGVLYTIEELYQQISRVTIVCAFWTTAVAVFITQNVFGISPLFQLSEITIISPHDYVRYVILAIVCGLLGTLFNYSLIATLKLASRFNIYCVLGFVFLSLFAVHLWFPEALGGREDIVFELVRHSFALKFLVFLLIVKFFFTLLSNTTALPGGMFLPVMIIGAIFGAVVAAILNPIFPPINNEVIIVLAMSGIFAAVFKAPLTAAAIVIELSGSFQGFLPLLAVCIISFIIAGLINQHSIYEMLEELSEKK